MYQKKSDVYINKISTNKTIFPLKSKKLVMFLKDFWLYITKISGYLELL